jgi:hypothetical protein
MDTSFYQSIKQIVLTISGLSKDAIHIYVGMTVFSAWVIVFKKTAYSLKSVLPVIAVALLMESIDIWDNFHTTGKLRLPASLHDILNTVFWPLMMVFLFKFIRKRKVQTSAYPENFADRIDAGKEENDE